ncbi:MAG: hypothetical protein Q9208_006592 [Pyrenodesmia sp. 3 TL-2023]
MDFLSSIHQAVLPQLGHISVSGYPLSVFPYLERYRISTSFRVHELLPLFPGLQLLTLKVRDMYHKPGLSSEGIFGVGNFSIKGLVDCQGYKELNYTTANDAFMNSFFACDELMLPDPQPSTWDATLKQKDGADSGASVEMVCGVDFSPLTEYETAQQRTTTRRTPIEIRVRRGRGATCTQAIHPDGRHLQPDVRHLFQKMTWKQMKEQGVYIERTEDGYDIRDKDEINDHNSTAEDVADDRHSSVTEAEDSTDHDQNFTDEGQNITDGEESA